MLFISGLYEFYYSYQSAKYKIKFIALSTCLGKDTFFLDNCFSILIVDLSIKESLISLKEFLIFFKEKSIQSNKIYILGINKNDEKAFTSDKIEKIYTKFNFIVDYVEIIIVDNDYNNLIKSLDFIVNESIQNKINVLRDIKLENNREMDISFGKLNKCFIL